MADKNLHDIKIDDLDSPKKTPLKNILTLLALLFIILVISVVITKLILSTDEGAKIDANSSNVELTDTTAETVADTNTTETTKESETTVPTISPLIKDRNLTSVIKTPLSTHQPKEIKTYKEPKKNTAPKETSNTPKKTPTATKNIADKKTTTQPKKEYISQTEPKKNTASTTSSKNPTYIGGKQKAVSNSYYIKVGTYRNSANIVAKIKKNNFNYSLVKVEDDKTLTRVLVGPFFSQNQAKAQLAKVKANILSGAYITKAK
ncbi:MAG: Unknown protein [uncultured Sulfurovum sp.]|uniref:SPOR domain-containing protein n=1 Tax=uncultured Sulfurovum sp. TaxID=269237 RepID=A0A6S6S8C1_9BACT|nr:MAG: Unknown protein [uncultured Sulfurovum sp.]